MEMLRKFFLIGLFVTIEPGTVLQIAIGTVVSAAYVVRNAFAPRARRLCTSVG
jgi:hypothetical protein